MYEVSVYVRIAGPDLVGDRHEIDRRPSSMSWIWISRVKPVSVSVTSSDVPMI